MWNNYQTWDKTKAYKSSKLGEKDLMFEETFFFFFYFPFLVSNHFQVTTNWESFFSFLFFVSESLTYTKKFYVESGGHPLWLRHWFYRISIVYSMANIIQCKLFEMTKYCCYVLNTNWSNNGTSSLWFERKFSVLQVLAGEEGV